MIYDDLPISIRLCWYDKVTMCVRSQHLTLSGDSPNYYAFPFAIGNLLPDWTNYYEGMEKGSIGIGGLNFWNEIWKCCGFAEARVWKFHNFVFR